MKWIRQSRHIKLKELQILEKSLTEFYLKPPEIYHEQSKKANVDWSQPDHVFHRRIIDHAFRGARILDVGCGPAMACPYFLDKGALYTGVDLSAEQLSLNNSRFPECEFLLMHWRDIVSIHAVYDIVTSFFVLEHIVHPQEFLKASFSCVKPGGLLCILCPHYLELGYMPSLYFFGRNPGGIRIKVRNREWMEVLIEVANRYIAFPIFLRRARFMAKRGGAWVINLRPAALDANSWERDWDAVYMASEDEISNHIESMGFRIVERGMTLRNTSKSKNVPNFCYVVAQKC